MLTSLRDALLHDVHSVNAERQALLASVRAEHDTSSDTTSSQAQLNHVTSHRLDRMHESRLSDYDVLTHVPKAMFSPASVL